MSESCHRGHVIQDDPSELRDVGRKQVWSMQRSAGLHKRMIIVKLSTKVDSLFQVRPAGCQFAPHREVSSPGSTAARHAYFEFRLKVLREELMTDFLQPPHQMFIYSVIDDVEETAVAARLPYPRRNFMAGFCSSYERTYIDDRDIHSD